jgi:dTDP-4-dehydrorhamnose reductase
MRILLTGASGQVGGAIKGVLQGHDVVAPTRGDFDLQQIESISSYVRKINPQLIINCAAYTAVDQAESEPDLAKLLNSAVPGLLATTAHDIGAGLIHFSTDYVFDGAAHSPYLEKDACAPLNVYGRSKLDGEQAISGVLNAHLIIRTAWVYSASGRNFLRTMLRLANEHSAIRVVDDQTGAPTSAILLAEAVAKIVELMNDAPVRYLRHHGGILNVTCRGSTTWYGFATAIFEELQKQGGPLIEAKPITTADYPTPARRPAYSVLDLARIKQEFSIIPLHWREDLSRVMLVIKDQIL